MRSGGALAAPAVLYLLLFFVIPAAIFGLYSFWISVAFETEHTFTLANYEATLTNGTFYRTTATALTVGLCTAVLAVALSFPMAYLLVFRFRSNLLLYLILASALSSYLVRVYAWRQILGENGTINRGLELLGVLREPLSFLLFSRAAVVLTLLNILLPFSLLLLRSAMSNVRPELLEAARDLGAGRLTAIRRVLVPAAFPGVMAAFMFTFVMAAGDYVTPQLVGGTGGLTTGVLIANSFILSGNWPLGAAMAFLLLAAFALTYAVVLAGARVCRLTPGVRWR